MKSYSADFRRALKVVRNLIKGMIKKNEDEKAKVENLIGSTIDKYVRSKECQTSGITKVIIRGNLKTTVKEAKLSEDLKKFITEQINKTESLSAINVLLENLLKDVQNVINVYNDDKVTKSVDVYLLLMLFEAIRINNAATSEVLAAAFGMNVCAALKEFEKGASVEHIEEIVSFGSYYNPDGSFKYNNDEIGYLERLTEICSNVNSKCSMPSFVDAVDPAMAMDLTIVLMKSNVENFEKAIKAFDSMDVVKETPASVSYNALASLKEYYRNGEIVKIPEDMEAFYKLLSACKLDEKEQAFILGLVEQAINEQKEDINLSALQGLDLETYRIAKGILETLYYTDPDYYIVVKAFQDLTSISELLIDNPDDEYLLSQKGELIAYLKEFNAKHLKGNEQSTNNLVLLGDYFASDLEELQGDKKARVLDILSRINKDNQARFRKIMTNENLSYVPYELIAKNVQVSFVELDTGIYALLGCAIDDSIYKTTINRIIKEESNLQIIEEGIKDPKRRNTILASAEDDLANLKEILRK